MSPSVRYELTPRALRDLRRVDPDMKRRILDALDRAIENQQQADVKKLRGEHEEWRLRAGDWRVRFRHDKERQIIVVTRILPRATAYRD